ncbi:MAG: hypothetical protein H6839_03470 [Planctomycetes bacterium]|nr:hypothetical protein [Planctomycetota bacterium]
MKTIAIILGALLIAPALLAADVESLLNEASGVKPGDSKAWVAARDRITALGEAALPDLLAAGAEANWTNDGWVRALVAETCRLRIEKPEVAQAVDKPNGLDPAVYKLMRKPEPHCQHHLKNLGADGTPLMLERWRWTFDIYEFSKGEDGKLERECYAKALLFAPGFNADRRARFALESALRDANVPAAWRQIAAVSFAQTGGTDALPTLNELFDDASQDASVREACGWAYGRVADIKSADALKARLTGDGLSPELQRALLTGVGLLGSSWTWKARGPMLQAAGDEVREACARMLVDALKIMPAEVNSISTALALTAYEASLDWVTELARTGEIQPVRDAAKACIEPLQTAVKRNK